MYFPILLCLKCDKNSHFLPKTDYNILDKLITILLNILGKMLTSIFTLISFTDKLWDNFPLFIFPPFRECRSFMEGVSAHRSKQNYHSFGIFCFHLMGSMSSRCCLEKISFCLWPASFTVYKKFFWDAVLYSSNNSMNFQLPSSEKLLLLQNCWFISISSLLLHSCASLCCTLSLPDILLFYLQNADTRIQFYFFHSSIFIYIS